MIVSQVETSSQCLLLRKRVRAFVRDRVRLTVRDSMKASDWASRLQIGLVSGL